MAGGAQEGRQVVGARHGQRVDDAAAGQLVEVLGQPRQPLVGTAQAEHAEAQALALQRPALHEDVVDGAIGADRQLVGDVVDHPLVRRRRRRQHRHVGPEARQRLADAPVVGPEVVAPVRDAVGLVDDEQADLGGERWQQAVPEVGVVEPFRADEQDVDRVVGQRRLDRAPLLGVRRVDRAGGDAGSLGRVDLVAHQRQQRRHDQRRTRAARSQQAGGDEVDGRLAPAGALDDECPPAPGDERVDRRPLILAERHVVAPDERPQDLLGVWSHARRRYRGGVTMRDGAAPGRSHSVHDREKDEQRPPGRMAPHAGDPCAAHPYPEAIT